MAQGVQEATFICLQYLSETFGFCYADGEALHLCTDLFCRHLQMKQMIAAYIYEAIVQIPLSTISRSDKNQSSQVEQGFRTDPRRFLLARLCLGGKGMADSSSVYRSPFSISTADSFSLGPSVLPVFSCVAFVALLPTQPMMAQSCSLNHSEFFPAFLQSCSCSQEQRTVLHLRRCPCLCCYFWIIGMMERVPLLADPAWFCERSA
jgi:hypothetical protein